MNPLAILGGDRCTAGNRPLCRLPSRLKTDLILIRVDERAGARLARQSGFGVTGTLEVLDQAGRQGLPDLAAAIDKLKTTTLRYPKSLVDELLSEHAQPKPTPRGWLPGLVTDARVLGSRRKKRSVIDSNLWLEREASTPYSSSFP